MAKNKTTENAGSVADFINTVADESKRNDSYQLAKIMAEQTGFEPKMWGPAIVGFGSYHYKYESGREGDMALVSFSPRANAISLYMNQEATRKAELLRIFGKHKATKGCIYINKLADIDVEVLKQMITESVKYMSEKHSAS